MYTVNQNFKDAVKSNVVTALARITLTSNSQVIDGENICSVTIKDYCYNNGAIIGTTMCKEVEIEIINDGFDLADEDFLLEVGVQYDNGTSEYIPYGNFVVKEYTDLKSNNKYKLIAYDYMDKLNTVYEDNNVYPMTLEEFYEAFATYYGLTVETQTLPNQSFVIQQMPEFSGATGRVILSYIAQMFGSFAKINRENKIQMYLSNTTSEQISREEMNSSLEIDNVYGPVNSLSLTMSNVTGENVTVEDSESIEEYGETAVEIADNPFVYTEALRTSAITGIFNRIKGFSYIPTEFKYQAYLYLDCGDTIQVQQMDSDNYINSIVLNQDIKLPATRQTKCSNKALTKTQVSNKYISPVEQKIKRTEIIVDKQNGVITALSGEIDENGEIINGLQADLEAQQARIQVIGKNINEEGDITAQNVVVKQGFTFNEQGLNIYTDSNSFNTQINNEGSYYKDGDTVVAQATKDGFMGKEFKERGQHSFGWDGTEYLFTSELVEVDGEYGYATFYNGND